MSANMMSAVGRLVLCLSRSDHTLQGIVARSVTERRAAMAEATVEAVWWGFGQGKLIYHARHLFSG